MEFEGENAYKEILQLLGNVSRAHRIYLFENGYTPDGKIFARERASWYTTDLENLNSVPHIDNFFYSEYFPHLFPLLDQGQHVSEIIDHLPSEERGQLEQQGVQTILLLPIPILFSLEDQFERYHP